MGPERKNDQTISATLQVHGTGTKKVGDHWGFESGKLHHVWNTRAEDERKRRRFGKWQPGNDSLQPWGGLDWCDENGSISNTYWRSVPDWAYTQTFIRDIKSGICWIFTPPAVTSQGNTVCTNILNHRTMGDKPNLLKVAHARKHTKSGVLFPQATVLQH